jgi:glycosyltransferase involved in cell wall biosynthesis
VHAQFERAPRPEADRAATLLRLGVRPPFLFYVGGYEPHKNVPGLLQAFALVRAQRPDLSLVLVGSKSLPDEVVACAERLGLRAGRDVTFLVNITDDMTDLYDEAELLATLSWRETFCLPALEAMTRGVPVIASAWGASPEVVGDAGRLVDPRDPRAAAVAILELIAPEQRDQLRARALIQSQKFHWEQTARQTLDVYEQLLRPRARVLMMGAPRAAG